VYLSSGMPFFLTAATNSQFKEVEHKNCYAAAIVCRPWDNIGKLSKFVTVKRFRKGIEATKQGIYGFQANTKPPIIFFRTSI
jgi:hypothetical protein